MGLTLFLNFWLPVSVSKHCAISSTFAKAWARWFSLPDRLAGRPPALDGPLAGITIDDDALKAAYYEAMDWDPSTGHPSNHKLAKLELQNL